MKIKTSEKLNEMFQKLNQYDYKYIDDILIEDADCYTTDGGSGLIEDGVKLCTTAQALGKPIHKVVISEADAFFIGNYEDVKNILHKKIQEAEKDIKDNRAFKQAKLSESERTKLLFLLDALKTAPEKSQKLIKIVKTKNTSTAFKQALSTLAASTDIKNSIVSLRQSLR